MSSVCAFTGHKLQSFPFGSNEADPRCIKLKLCLCAQITKLIEEMGVTHFISGMGLGVDLFAAELVLCLKNAYPHISLECAIPFETKAVKWNESMRERYFDVAAHCDKETLLQRQYTPDCIYKRNRYLVDQADIILAVWDGRPSGSGMTVRYARERQRLVWVIDPTTLEVDYGSP
jgi:uncharacterized phage-like protein YoqJ